MKSMHDALTETMKVYDRADGKIEGLSTGIDHLDQVMGGVRPGTLTVIASLPQMGKTSLGLQWAWHLASQKKNVAIFSYDLIASNICYRFISQESKLSLKSLSNKKISGEELRLLPVALESLSKKNVRLEDNNSITITSLVEEVRKEHAEKPIHFLLVDPLHLIPVKGSISTSLNQVRMVLPLLKSLAMDLNIPVVVTYQLNKDSKYDGGNYLLTEVEQLSDYILLIDRDDYFEPYSAREGVARISILKNRYGQSAYSFECAWRKDILIYQVLKDGTQTVELQKYRNLSGTSAVISYAMGEDFIDVVFDNNYLYRYSHKSTGLGRVEEMKIRALAGDGLSRYISDYVGKDYEFKRRQRFFTRNS